MNLPALLVRLYPAPWRAEYGAELEALLERTPLTLGAALNVASHAIRQRSQRVDPGAPLLGVVAVTVTIWNLLAPLDPLALSSYSLFCFLTMCTAAYRATWRNCKASSAAAAAFFICYGADCAMGELMSLGAIPTRPLLCQHAPPSVYLLLTVPWVGLLIAGVAGVLGATAASFVKGLTSSPGNQRR